MFFYSCMVDTPEREPIVITRVEQIRDSHWLIANCKTCCHSARLDCEALLDRFGPWLAIDDVRSRLRCASCGSREVEMHTVSPGAGGIKNPAVATRG